jgi:4-amino-4-deoxy-L-arabinose transferase-like glycosyltransferase
MFVTGFDDDEAYTIVIARRLALSYFDHPPLHQWIVHAFVALFGEGHADRAPFWLIVVATNAPLFGLTRRLFGVGAALWALFAFDATPYFLVLPDGFIMPDAPLLFFLATAAWAIAEVLFGPAGRSRAGPLWLAAGLSLGAAGLSKYSAIFAPIGLLGFFLGSPRHRHWLWDARPYLGAALGLLVFSPALVWNAQNHWISFAFQSNRAATGLDFGAKAWVAVAAGLGAQVALLSPWVGAPLVAGLARAGRGDADGGERFLLWLVAPPLLLFALIPLLGQRAIPHWFNSAWLFAFPLAGNWLSARSADALRRWARSVAALSVAVVALYLAAVIVGPSRFVPFAPTGPRDPTRFSYDWPSLASSPAWRSGPPEFVVVDNWRVGGRVGVALGPKVPICAFTGDPRGFAFQCDPRRWLGKDALIVVPEESVPTTLASYFRVVDPAAIFPIGRGGGAERVLAIARARGLTRPYPLPYGPPR